MKITKIFLTVLVISFSLSSQYLLAQNLEIKTSQKVQISYEPFSGFPASSTLTINIKNLDIKNTETNNSQKSRARIRIAPSQGAFIATDDQKDTLPLKLTSQQNSSRLQKLGNQYFENINLNLTRQERFNFNYSISIDESQFTKPGIYRLLLDVDIRSLPNNEIISNNEVVEVTVLVRPKLQANIAGSHSNKISNVATIDFGELQSNETGIVFIQVQGNTDAEIILSSENSGRLINKSEQNATINYAIDFDGQKSKLTNPLRVSRPVAKTLRGSSYPLKVIIGDVEGSYSGQYKDLITIDVNPQ